MISGKKALIVDDDGDSQTLAKAHLAKIGLMCDSVSDGEEALGAVGFSNYDLIFMDVKMPGMNGLEATSRIREHELRRGKKRVPIIALTVSHEKEKAMHAGIDDIVLKPIDLQSLSSVVEKWLS